MTGFPMYVIGNCVAQRAQIAAAMAALAKGASNGHRTASTAVHGGADQASDPADQGADLTLKNVSAAIKALRAIEGPVAHEGIRAGEVVGWRVWRIALRADEPELRSRTTNTVWHPNEIMVGEVTYFGVHAWKSKEAAIDYAFGPYDDQLGPYVVGTVYLWGEIVEHSRGYRAQYAAIRSLDLRGSDWAAAFFPKWQARRKLAKLRKSYNIPSSVA